LLGNHSDVIVCTYSLDCAVARIIVRGRVDGGALDVYESDYNPCFESVEQMRLGLLERCLSLSSSPRVSVLRVRLQVVGLRFFQLMLVSM
jgi:hypothetical protein